MVADTRGKPTTGGVDTTVPKKMYNNYDKIEYFIIKNLNYTYH